MNGKAYQFYGWENADCQTVTDIYKGIETPRDLYDRLSELWCAATCAPRMRDAWTRENKTLGQCSITAFLVQDIFGGEVRGILREGGNYHCFNVIGDREFDLTSEQFGEEKLDYTVWTGQTRESHFAKQEKRERYELLKERLKLLVYRTIKPEEMTRELFRDFIRHQVVEKCWRREAGEWIIKDDPFVDDWSEEDYQFLTQCLKHTIETGGLVYGVFWDGRLKGFVSVEAERLGSRGQYLDLTSIHVSEDLRGQGIGEVLFGKAGEWAKEHGAEKLYISAHSAVESQGFYKKVKCVEAEEYVQRHVDAEPYDCQLECRV